MAIVQVKIDDDHIDLISAVIALSEEPSAEEMQEIKSNIKAFKETTEPVVIDASVLPKQLIIGLALYAIEVVGKNPEQEET